MASGGLPERGGDWARVILCVGLTEFDSSRGGMNLDGLTVA